MASLPHGTLGVSPPPLSSFPSNAKHVWRCNKACCEEGGGMGARFLRGGEVGKAAGCCCTCVRKKRPMGGEGRGAGGKERRGGGRA